MYFYTNVVILRLELKFKKLKQFGYLEIFQRGPDNIFLQDLITPSI